MVRIAVVLAVAMMFNSAAKAVVMVGFDINFNSTVPLFVYSNGGTATNLTDDTFVGSSSVDFTVGIDGGMVHTFSGAIFSLTGTPTAITDADIVSQHTITMDGSLSIIDSATMNTVLTIDFTNAELVLQGKSSDKSRILLGLGFGGANANNGQNVVYTAGSELAALLPAGMTLGGFQSFHFTTTGFKENIPAADADTFVRVSTAGGVQDAFQFDSSFSGEAELVSVPEPATLGLIGLGVLVMARSRRSNVA
ncbi:MAG: PEP-CTERM sorting domain-containing protein [Planctomycetes bacterium]|nr:PEP-CTERM sorting domain-containing protein [Planctomycetota bacterium]